MNMYYRLLICLWFCSSVTSLMEANNSTAAVIKLDLNNKLVIGGAAFNGTDNEFALVRLNLDGSFDPTFNSTGTTPGTVTTSIQNGDASISAITIDASNRIIAVGTLIPTFDIASTIMNGANNKFVVARYTNDGILDVTFNATGSLPGGPGMAVISIGSLNDTATAVALDSQKRIIVVGSVDTGVNTDIGIVRLTPNGDLDTSFRSNIGQPGISMFNIFGTTETQNASNDSATCVTIGNSDSIFISGSTSLNTNTEIFLLNLLSTGALNVIFPALQSPTGSQITNSPPQQPPIISTPFPGCLVYNINGIDDEIFAMGLDVNANLVLAGYTTETTVTQEALVTNNLLVRFTQSGLLLETIPNNINGVDSAFSSLTFDADNRIIASGSYNTGTNLAYLTARFNIDGTLDATFNPTGALSNVTTINSLNQTVMGTMPGTLVTNILTPNFNQNFFSNDNAANGVVTDANLNLYVTGYANDGTQTDFTTISYLPNGVTNSPGFNASGLQPFAIPGIVYNVLFGTAALGNGVPLYISFEMPPLAQSVISALSSKALNYFNPIINAPDQAVTSDYEPTITGLAMPNVLVSLLINDVPVTTTMSDAKGMWAAVVPALEDGLYSVTAISTDPLTGIDLASKSIALTINTAQPPQPVITLPKNQQVIKTTELSFAGTAQPLALVTLVIDNKSIGNVQASAEGKWSVDTTAIPLSDGRHRIYVVATDAAGSRSIPSEGVDFTLDTGKQWPLYVLAPTSGMIIRQSPVIIQGQAKPNTSLRLYVNKALLGIVKTNSLGLWAFGLPVTNGEYRIYTTTLNNQLMSNVVIIDVNTTPQKPVSKRAPAKGLISGHSDPGAIVILYLDGAPLATVKADAAGDWSYSPPANTFIPKGQHQLKIALANVKGQIKQIVEQSIEI